jgi:outer membrane protein
VNVPKIITALAAASLVAFAAVADVTPEPGTVITLQEALRRVVDANPTARTARAEVAAAEAQRRFYRAAILPQLEFSGSNTLNAEEVTLDFEGTDVTLLPSSDYSYSLKLSQPVFAGGRELKTIRQSGLAVESAREGVRETENQLLLQTATSYLAAVEGQALVDVEAKNLELALKRRKQASDFFSAGEVTQVDVLRADTAVKAAERRLASAVQMRDVGLSQLRIALAIDSPIQVTSPKFDFPSLLDEERLIAQAQAGRPEVLQATMTRRSAELEVSKQRAWRLPTVTAEAVARTQASNFPSAQTAALTFNISMPIFDFGAISSRVAMATERKKQAEYNLEQAGRLVREDVRQALIGLRSAQTNLSLAKEQLAAAEAEYEQAFELYRAQEVTSLDVATAESTLAESRRAVVTGTLDLDLAELRVWYSAGSLKDVLITEVQP